MKQATQNREYYFPVCFTSSSRFSLQPRDAHQGITELTTLNPKTKTMKTILSLTTGMQKMLIVVTFGLLSVAANSTGNHKGIQPIVIPAATAQPVEQISFSATLINNKADLKWTAESDNKISHFLVEKSTDGINYHDAALVFAFEDPTEKMGYQYGDKLGANQPEVVYYRLCMIADNGTVNYSAIVIVKRGDKKGQ
jgi:hypothetical protein